MSTIVDAGGNRHCVGMRRFLQAVGLIAGTTLFGLGIAGPAGATLPAAASDCTNGVQVVSFAFTPATVSPGQTATATLVLQSCTGAAQQDSVQWYGRFSDANNTIPAGCPAIDPIIRPAPVPATGQFTGTMSFLVPASCTAAINLEAIATIRGSDSSTLATVTANATISGNHNGGTCGVSYNRVSEWPGGFVANVTLTNSGATALTGWSLAFTFGGDQRITNAWNTVVSQSGAAVTAANAPYNGSVPVGGSVTFGFQGTWHSSDAPPTGYQLNGVTCRVA